MKQLLLAATAVIGLAASASASPISIIQLAQNTSGNTVVTTNNLGLTGAMGATVISINDQTADITQLLGIVPPAGTINGAFVELHATSTDNAVTLGIGILQNFSGTFCVSALAGCTGTDYLSGKFTDAAFGVSGGSQLSLNVASPPDVLNLVSDDIPASKLAAPSSLTFGFTSLTPTPPGLGVGANGSINGFTASFTMNASASTAVPEPASVALLGFGLLGLGIVARKRTH
jgi:hypothetical protein